MASHELRTPLSLVMGYSELLRDRDFSRGEVREMAAQINEGAQRLTHLVNDLLLFSEHEAGRLTLRPQPLQVADLVREVVGQFARQGEHRFVIEVPVELPAPLADPQRIRQVLTNLLSNAVKFSPPGSTVTVRAREIARGEADGRAVEISVRDQGMGISASERGRVFEPFFRGRQSEELCIPGTGLGLSIVQRLVELHGGSVHVESEPGAGSTFTVRLPVGD